jgi:hypothetical protein
MSAAERVPVGVPDPCVFSGWPHERRMAVWAALEGAGGEVGEYVGRGLTVRYARGRVPEARSALHACGLAPSPGSLVCFPICSDNPPESMRHDGRHPGSRGFWLVEHWAPGVEDEAPCMICGAAGGHDPGCMADPDRR